MRNQDEWKNLVYIVAPSGKLLGSLLECARKMQNQLLGPPSVFFMSTDRAQTIA